MLKDVTPAAIVIRAEAEPMAGMKELAQSVRNHYQQQRAAQDCADTHGLEIGRLVCERAARADVLAKLTALNAQRIGGGRPKVAHCFVAEQLITAGVGVSQRHIERCSRAYKHAQEKGLSLSTPIRIAEASAIVSKLSDKPLEEVQPSPERLFNSEGDPNPDDEKFDPERDAISFAKKLQSFFFTRTGHPRIRGKREKEIFGKRVNETLEEMNIDWVFEPKGGGQ